MNSISQTDIMSGGEIEPWQIGLGLFLVLVICCCSCSSSLAMYYMSKPRR